MTTHETTRYGASATVLQPAGELLPQAVVGIQPSGPPDTSILGTLKSKLRITDAGTGNFLYSRVRQDGVGPGGLRVPPGEDLRTPKKSAVVAAKILRRRHRATVATGGQAAKAGSADTAVTCRNEAIRQLRGMFPCAPGSQALLQRLLDLGVPGLMPYERPLLVGKVLSRMTRGDVAMAGELLDGLASPEPQDGAFAAQLALARCGGPGIDCLLAFGPRTEPPDDPGLAAIQREAYAARLHTADQLCSVLPPDQRPRSLAACVDLARRAAAHPASADGRALGAHGILVHGLVCAQSLADDPASDAPPAQQRAYLAVRNGIYARSALEQTQARLFKINTYIDRASERGVRRFTDALMRLVGYRKSPLIPLVQMGTAQSKTRHPADDLAARGVALDIFVLRMEEQLAAVPPLERHGATALRRSIRIAVARHWKRHIVEKGWCDTWRMGSATRRSVCADVAAQLGCSADVVARHPALQGLQALQASALDGWAKSEKLDYAHAAGPGVGNGCTLGDAMTRFLQMHDGGDVLLRRPTREQARELLFHAIDDTRQTYSVSFTQSNTLGLNAAVIDILAVTPAVVGVGGTIGVSGSRGAYVQVGSNVHGGQIHVGSQRNGHAEVGVSGFVGKKLGDVVTLGLTGNLTPLAADHTRTRATVLRTRMNAHGSTDPEAWRKLLTGAYDSITWKDGEAGPPDDAEQMWGQLSRFYKNPDLSIDDLHSRLTTAGGGATLTGGIRTGVIGGTQLGPGISTGFNKTYQNTLRQSEEGGNRTTELNANAAGHGGFASAGLTGIAPSITGGAIQDNIGHPGTTQSVALSSASFGAKSVSFWTNRTGVTTRLVTDQGRVDADFSVMDTETGSAASFAAYIDSQRAAWLAALGGDKAAATELDTFLTRLRDEEVSGNVTYGERRRLTPLAALQIDHFRAMAAAAGDSTAPADKGLQREVARLEGEVTRVLNDPTSWDPRSMWVLDLNQSGASKGLSVILQLVSRKVVSAPRQRAVLIARQAENRARVQEAVF